MHQSIPTTYHLYLSLFIDGGVPKSQMEEENTTGRVLRKVTFAKGLLAGLTLQYNLRRFSNSAVCRGDEMSKLEGPTLHLKRESDVHFCMNERRRDP
jgi:hypothetical protein